MKLTFGNIEDTEKAIRMQLNFCEKPVFHKWHSCDCEYCDQDKEDTYTIVFNNWKNEEFYCPSEVKSRIKELKQKWIKTTLDIADDIKRIGKCQPVEWFFINEQ